MIDIHSHILPCIDDGAKNLEKSIEMARMAVADGTTAVIATPHTCDGVFNSQKEDVLNGCRVLNDILDQEGINLEILPGQEIRLTPELLELIDDDAVLTLNHSDHILIELPNLFISSHIPMIIREITHRDLVPVIAHPERNRHLMTHPDLMEDMLYMGARFQITAGSLTGVFGRNVKKYATGLARNGWIHFVASDAHDTMNRSPIMSKGLRILEQIARGNVLDSSTLIVTRIEQNRMPA